MKGMKLFGVLLLVLGLLINPIVGDPVFAAENTGVKLSQTGGYFASQGDNNVLLKIQVANNSNEKITFLPSTGLPQSSGALTEPNPNEGTISLGAGKATEVVFTINVAGNAPAETHYINVTLIDKGPNSGQVLRTGKANIQVSKKASLPVTGNQDTYLPAADLVHSLSPNDAIVAGVKNKLSLSFVNRGNVTMRDTKVNISLPEGITIDNSSSTLSVGYVGIGDAKTVAFPLVAETSMASKNYPITVRIIFNVMTSSGSGNDANYFVNEHTIEQTLYIPVQASGSSASLSGLSITNINLPKQVLAGEDFTLNFKLANAGNNGTGQVKIYAEPQSGIVNRSQNAFVEKDIKAGETKSYSINFFTTDQTSETSYTIKLIAESLSGEGDSIQQYTAVYVKNTGSDSIKTPQLMVSSYDYGGSFVQAGDEFRLNLDLRNTSSAHNLRNIKVTLESGDGTFIPVKSSNSFFIDRINKGGYTSQSMYLSTKPDAEQKTTSVNIAMSYEDTEGNAFTSTDVISIPVMQDTRLLVDDIIAPPEMYMGMPNGVSVDFYNMGRTRLNNLRINAEGDFDTMESNSYYVGNMEPGTEDSYDFSFMPRDVGLMTGKIIFTYEDASGDQQTYEKEFEFQIMEMPAWDEDPFQPDDMNGEGGKIPWIPIVIALVVIGGVAFILIRRRRRKKMIKEMEIDE